MTASNETNESGDDYVLTLPAAPYVSANEQKRASANEQFDAEWAQALTTLAYFESLSVMHIPWAVRVSRTYRRRLDETAFVERHAQIEYLRVLNSDMDDDMNSRY